MGALGKFTGGLIFVGSILGAIAWGIYVWIFWGIFGIVDGALSTPIDVHMVVWGVLWVLSLAKLSAIGIMIVGMIFGGFIMAVSGGERWKVFGIW
jgi:hypothetical protein